MDKTKSPWTVPVAVDDIPETGLHIEIEAPESVRTGLASIGDLRDLPRLAAVFEVARNGAGVHVTGEVHARIGQTCVVTLEAIENDLDEPVDLVFALVSAQAEAKGSEEPPESLVGGKLDLGAIATEFLLLG